MIRVPYRPIKLQQVSSLYFSLLLSQVKGLKNKYTRTIRVWKITRQYPYISDYALVVPVYCRRWPYYLSPRMNWATRAIWPSARADTSKISRTSSGSLSFWSKELVTHSQWIWNHSKKVLIMEKVVLWGRRNKAYSNVIGWARGSIVLYTWKVFWLTFDLEPRS